MYNKKIFLITTIFLVMVSFTFAINDALVVLNPSLRNSTGYIPNPGSTGGFSRPETSLTYRSFYVTDPYYTTIRYNVSVAHSFTTSASYPYILPLNSSFWSDTLSTGGAHCLVAVIWLDNVAVSQRLLWGFLDSSTLNRYWIQISNTAVTPDCLKKVTAPVSSSIRLASSFQGQSVYSGANTPAALYLFYERSTTGVSEGARRLHYVLCQDKDSSTIKVVVNNITIHSVVHNKVSDFSYSRSRDYIIFPGMINTNNLIYDSYANLYTEQMIIYNRMLDDSEIETLYNEGRFFNPYCEPSFNNTFFSEDGMIYNITYDSNNCGFTPNKTLINITTVGNGGEGEENMLMSNELWMYFIQIAVIVTTMCMIARTLKKDRKIDLTDWLTPSIGVFGLIAISILSVEVELMYIMIYSVIDIGMIVVSITALLSKEVL